MFFLSRMLANKLELPDPAHALPGRNRPIATARTHHVFRRPLKAPLPEGCGQALFALGEFHRAEKLFWGAPGVVMTAAGYTGGYTPNPTHQEVLTGLTGHAEAVRIDFDPAVTNYATLLRLFWQGHDPTQGMRQGADIGTAFRSAIFAFDDAQRKLAMASRDACAAALAAAGRDRVATVIDAAGPFFHAEAEHQQYLAKNPGAAPDARAVGVAIDWP